VTSPGGPDGRPPQTATGRPVRRRSRFLTALAIVVGLLVAVNALHAFGPRGTGLVAGPLMAAILVVLGRQAWGLSWHDLGLSRLSWRRGARWAAAAVLAVGGVFTLGAWWPLTRVAFLDSRYATTMATALLTAFVIIPLGTVFVEEIAFRGVLQGLLTRRRGVAWGLGASSALFGLWHVLPSLDLDQANQAVGAVAGHTPAAQVGVVAAVVAFTALAGLILAELRRRSGSLLAAAGLHWAVNGVGVLVAAAIYR
jgi:membrane protease YdiL (CAAX protease family)